MNLPKPLVTLVPYTREYLARSWDWLSDPETRQLTRTPEFLREDQESFFVGLVDRKDYRIWGIKLIGTGPIGAAGIKNIQGETGEYWGYIGEKHWRGRGIGRQMLADVEVKARELGLEELTLHVWNENTPAIKLYKQAGFVADSVDGEVMHMRKMLG